MTGHSNRLFIDVGQTSFFSESKDCWFGHLNPACVQLVPIKFICSASRLSPGERHCDILVLAPHGDTLFDPHLVNLVFLTGKTQNDCNIPINTCTKSGKRGLVLSSPETVRNLKLQNYGFIMHLGCFRHHKAIPSPKNWVNLKNLKLKKKWEWFSTNQVLESSSDETSH